MTGYRYHNPNAPLYVCEACAALVEEADRDTHNGHHDTIAALAAHISRRKSMHHHDQRGITTAEYAVGTAAGAGLAGLLYKLLTGGFGDQLLRTLFDHVLGLLGIG